MGDLVALASIWSGLSGSTAKKLQTLNATMVSGQATDLPVSTMTDFIRNNGKLAGLAAFVNNTPSSPDAGALLACNYIAVIFAGGAGTTIPATQVQPLLAILSNVSNDVRTGVTAPQFALFNNICLPSVVWWQAHGFSQPISLYDLIAAGNLS